ncbi:hypothetical protein H4R18_002010 [Coemansia javaensis]|uniref:Myb-like domain-containing protein n=1 Tax=Coemansia javaensis TaxID=2761396 RepID=A0A9W8HIU6_9FUNG|nr:hypothetical protein H4R18_002010 [Coemansia javaensis]
MPLVRRSRRLATATRTVVEVVVERPAARPPARSTADKLAAAAATSRGWRARVTECADQAYDTERGRIDWEAVAAELRLPLVGCLHMFDASLSVITVRQLPGPARWSKDDRCAILDFVSDNFGTLAGDVWRLAGVYINASEADCLAAYRRLKHSKITAGVREAIQKYREDGMSWGDIHNMFPVYSDGLKLKYAFDYTRRHGPSTPDSRSHSQAKWTPAETERIEEIVKQYYIPSYPLPAVNAAVREFPDRTRVAIKHKAPGSQQERMDAINQEVQRQRESGLDIDWVAVGQAAGLSELRCLELCRFSEGKARWTYDSDTFSRKMADRMEAFIAEHYPPPAAPNFNAVSNYMWIDINDCIRMAGMLRGEFEWTDEARARVVRMWEQGMSYKEIARQLSPNLTAARIDNCIGKMKRPRRHVSLTPEEKQRVRSIVEENSGKMSFREVVGLAARTFACPKRRAVAFGYVKAYCLSLPLYKARLEAADKDQIARDILSGATTATEAARRLDVPPALATGMAEKLQSRMYSRVWTSQEMEQLLEYIRTHTPPYSWKAFSALLGTKSQRQCRLKIGTMRRGGAIPDMPES